ncbi:MAG: hypothetical protein IKI30_04905 [Oxalobacter sp.]|nr:hypothetical protein [Oxalobacter sp.]
MKDRIGKILLSSIIVITGVLLSGCGTGKEISALSSVSYCYTSGSMAYSNCSYSLRSVKGKYIAKVRPVGVPDEKAVEAEVDETVMREIEAVFKKYEVGQWDGFKKYNRNVMDGRSFSLSLMMKNGDSLDASGYMEWPKNFSSVRQELDAIFMKIYRAHRPESR